VPALKPQGTRSPIGRFASAMTWGLAAAALFAFDGACTSKDPGPGAGSQTSGAAGPTGGADAAAGAKGGVASAGDGGSSASGDGLHGGTEGGATAADARDAALHEAGAPSDGDASLGVLSVTRLRCDLRTNPLQVESVTPRLNWEIETADLDLRGERQAFFEVLVASSAQNLAMDQGDVWSSGSVQSTASRTIYSGPPLASLAHVFWKVRIRDAEGRLSTWSDAAEWTQGLSGTADWAAQWIGGATAGATMPIFRRQFDVTKGVRRALVSVCGLGQYEVRLNGTNVSDGVLEPGWTNFAKTCLYRTFDVTKAVIEGSNAIGVLLGNGMYNVPATPGRYAKFTGSFGGPKVIARLHIDFADGTGTDVVTDASWHTTAGPITFTGIYGGEDFDARSEPPGWDAAGFNDTSWALATVVGGVAPALVAQSEPPVKVMQEFSSVAVTQPQPGVFVYDLGQNFSGWPVLEVTGAPGAVVRLTPGEILSAQGTVTQSSMGGGPIWFQYTLRGGGAESWHPRFAYTGFRYVQVAGAAPAASAASFPNLPQIVSLTGQFVHTSAEQAGDFTCSDPDVNKIHALILAAVRSNLQSILTDCPQREKLGWLETGQLLGRAMMFNLDLESLYEQEVANMRDAQIPSGLVPSIAPEVTTFAGDFRDSPEWGSAYLLDSWNVYQMYGDADVFQQNYAGMKRYVDYLSGKSAQGFLAYGLGDWYDVGPLAPGRSQLTSSGVTATGTLVQDATVLSKVAPLVGHPADAAQYAALATAAANAYGAKFWNPAGYYDRNSQTANAIPLALGMATAATRPMALAALVQAVTSAQNRVTAGEIGFTYVVGALSGAGRSDVLLAMLKQRAAAGYLYQIDHGATSLTEAWDADPSSSQNHAMLGHAERWFWEGLAGFTTDEAGPGFQRFVVQPQMPTGIDSVQANYHSAQGVISSGWVRHGTGVEMTVSVPVNALATIYVPTQSPATVTESGNPVETAPGVTAVRPGTGGVAVDVGSGHYDFVAN
jgi:alpha-L-rhamnosidase